MASPEFDKILTIKEVSKILKIHPESARKLTSKEHDSLPAFKVGGMLRVRRSSLDAWMEQQENKKRKPAFEEVSEFKTLDPQKLLKGGTAMKVKRVTKSRWFAGFGGFFWKKDSRGIQRWYIWIYDGNGKRIHKAVELVTDEKEAMIALKYELEQMRKRAFVQKYLPDQAEELGLLEEDEKSEAGKMKFSSLGEEWMKQSTRKNKRNDASVLKNLNQIFGKKKITDISRVDIKRYTADSMNSGIAGGTVRQRLQVMRAIFYYGIEMKYLKENPVVAKDFPKEKNGQKQPLDMEEIKLLFSTAEKIHPHMLPVMTTAFMTGMRRGEIETLSWEDVDLESRAIKVKAENNKSGRDKEIPVNDILYPVLADLKSKANGNPFVFTYSNPRFGRETQIPIGFHFTEIVKKAGLKGRAHFHLIRHTAASMLARAGADPVSIQAILGHANISTTQKYLHPYGDAKRIAVKKLESQLNIGKLNGQDSAEISDYPCKG